MKTWLLTILLSSIFSLGALSGLKNENGRFAVTGGFASSTITWLGPITTAAIKIGVGGEYWFSNNFALGADLGLGSEGYGKVIGTTSLSLVNLKTGNFLLDPGITA